MKLFANIKSSISRLVANQPFVRGVVLLAALLSLSGGAARRVPLTERIHTDDSEIDAALQAAATTALGNRQGSIVIMDAQTGRVRAIVNSEAAYEQALMPGSAIKPFTALAALRAGVINKELRTACPGRFTGLSFSLPCVHADHLPPFSPSQAIAYSCNYYFASLGQRLDRDDLIKTLREFDFGQPTGFSAADEVAGVIRPCEQGAHTRLRNETAHHASAQADCSARAAVGESDHIQITPIQLLTAYSALLNGGHLYQPRIAPAAGFEPAERARLSIADEHRAVIAEGMAGAVRYGTARAAKLDALPLNILGKTGTALPAKGFRTNGWFIGLAASFNSTRQTEPSAINLAVIVLLERAHGADAALAARPIFETYANELRRRAEPERDVSNANAGKKNEASRLPPDGSRVRVHLVNDNVTREESMEDYVLGVMQAEGTTESEPEALKALAISARTYALRNLGRHAKDGYDFCSTTHCQRFSVRSPSVSEGQVDNQALPNGRASDMLAGAVRATAGQVLFDDRNQLVDSYFGASCGGETANIGELWGVTPPAYLRGVRDEYCVSGPHARWTDTVSRHDLMRALKSDARTDPGNHLDQVMVSRQDETGRAEFIAIEGAVRKKVRGWDFKIIVGRVLGWNVLKSSRFQIARSGSNFIFRGTGFGHGLGLCQEGAHVMATRGMNYQKILEKYFPGTRVRANSEVRRQGPVAAWRADVLGARAPSPARRGIQALKQLSRFALTAGEGARAPSRLLTISSEHFRLTYPADVDRRDANQALSTLEAARTDYLNRVRTAGFAADIPTLAIRFNESTGDFTGRTGQPWWAAAATKGNRIEFQPFGLLKRRGVLFTTLRHELAHAIIDMVSRTRAPRWLSEGFALYLAGEGRTISRYAGKQARSIDELESRMEHPRSQQEMRELYAQAYLAVAEIVRSQGEGSVWKRLAN